MTQVSKKKDVLLGIISICFAAFIFYIAVNMPGTRYAGDPGPGMMPMIGSIVMAIFGVSLVVRPKADAKAGLSGKAQWLAALRMFALYVMAALLFWLFGFNVAVPVIIFAAAFMMSKLSAGDASVKSRLIKAAIFAVIASVLLYLAYIVGLKASLPRGAFWEWIG